MQSFVLPLAGQLYVRREYHHRLTHSPSRTRLLVIVPPWRAQIAHVVFAWQIIPFPLEILYGRRERTCFRWGGTVVS